MAEKLKSTLKELEYEETVIDTRVDQFRAIWVDKLIDHSVNLKQSPNPSFPNHASSANNLSASYINNNYDLESKCADQQNKYSFDSTLFKN